MYYYVAVDLERPVNPKELTRIADGIADIWKRVGLELGLSPQKLNTIERNHHGNNGDASLDMLLKWREINIKVARSVLHQAIDYCRANRGTHLLIYDLNFVVVGLSNIIIFIILTFNIASHNFL